MERLTTFSEFESFLARFTNYERVQHFKYDKKTLGIERMRSFAREAGSPDLAYPSVHVAGTKGKGSTSLMLEALLAAEGYRVGTYTSPHVEHLRERVRIHGEPVAEDELLREMNELLPALERRKQLGALEFPSFFELMTALAMCLYRSKAVDWAVFEVGLGGRFDATNILSPRWTAITSIGLEHTQQLGGTLALIAREKAGIIKPGTPVVIGPLPTEAEDEIRRIAASRDAPVIAADTSSVALSRPGRIRVRGLPEPIPSGPVLGPALRLDLAIALEILRGLLEAEGRTPSPRGIEAAIGSLGLPARIERIVLDTRGMLPVVIDGAHTAESVEALRLTLEEIEFPRPRTLIFSIANGKELARILPQILQIAEDVILTLADPVRSVPPWVLQKELGLGRIEASPELALEDAIRRERPIVVTGSFYLAGRLRPLLVPRATVP